MSAAKCPSIALSLPFFIFESWIFLLLPFEEKKSKLKNVQLLLVSPVIYWFSNMIFDLPMLYFYGTILFIVFGIMDKKMEDLLKENIGGFNRLRYGLVENFDEFNSYRKNITRISADVHRYADTKLRFFCFM